MLEKPVIYPVILAGGRGKRLWPLSRDNFPKQFIKFINNKSLFQNTFLRFLNSDLINYEKITTITNSNYRFIVNEQIQEINQDFGEIILEPEGKNTAPSILLSSIHIYNYDKDAIILVSPSDHVMPQSEILDKKIGLSINEVKNDKIITFGILPSRVETGYGYIELAKYSIDEVIKIKSFTEKPNYELASEMVLSRKYLWNSGIFFFKAAEIISKFKKYEPQLTKIVTDCYENRKKDLNFYRVDNTKWSKCKNISIDFAIMEKIQDIYTVIYDGDWIDLGSWESLWLNKKDKVDNVYKSKDTISVNCKNSILLTENSSKPLVGIGLENIIAIVSSDVVLVADKNKSDDLKDITKLIGEKKFNEIDFLSKDFRPWGWYEIILNQKNFKVKKIFINSNSSISLQSHKHRSEHWVVVEGQAKVTLNEKVINLKKGESIFISKGSKHRLENVTKDKLQIIEVQIGKYLEEDDIIRYEDNYGRI